MELSALDTAFIRLVARTESHGRLLRRKLETKQEILSHPENGRLPSFIKSFALHLYLFGELLLVAGRESKIGSNKLVFYESNQQTISARIDYLRHHLPKTDFHPVIFRSHPACIPGYKRTFWLFFRSSLLIFLSLIWPSELAENYARIIRVCLVLHSHVLVQKQKEVYLFQIHRMENYIAASYLREQGILVNLIASTTPLTPHNRLLIADSLKLCNPYQKDEFLVYSKDSLCCRAEMWSPEDIVTLASYYQKLVPNDYPNILGLYTQGFWLRNEMGKMVPEIGQKLAEQEEQLLQILKRYLEQRPEMMLIIYPHPLERSHFAKSGGHQFVGLLDQAQVTIDFSGANSLLTFNSVGLGLTTVSTIGFDRVYMGFRTLFYIPEYAFMNLEVASPYNALFLDKESDLISKIDKLRVMTNNKFMAEYFDGPFWLPEEGRKEV